MLTPTASLSSRRARPPAARRAPRSRSPFPALPSSVLFASSALPSSKDPSLDQPPKLPDAFLLDPTPPISPSPRSPQTFSPRSTAFGRSSPPSSPSRAPGQKPHSLRPPPFLLLARTSYTVPRLTPTHHARSRASPCSRRPAVPRMSGVPPRRPPRALPHLLTSGLDCPSRIYPLFLFSSLARPTESARSRSSASVARTGTRDVGRAAGVRRWPLVRLTCSSASAQTQRSRQRRNFLLRLFSTPGGPRKASVPFEDRCAGRSVCTSVRPTTRRAGYRRQRAPAQPPPCPTPSSWRSPLSPAWNRSGRALPAAAGRATRHRRSSAPRACRRPPARQLGRLRTTRGCAGTASSTPGQPPQPRPPQPLGQGARTASCQLPLRRTTMTTRCSGSRRTRDPTRRSSSSRPSRLPLPLPLPLLLHRPPQSHLQLQL